MSRPELQVKFYFKLMKSTNQLCWPKWQKQNQQNVYIYILAEGPGVAREKNLKKLFRKKIFFLAYIQHLYIIRMSWLFVSDQNSSVDALRLV